MMMKNREFRELQVSSTQLAIIFLGILVIGVIIFLLGVSVGKKHAQIAQKSNVIAQKDTEQVKEKFSLPEAKPGQEPVKTSTRQLAPGQKEALTEKPKEQPKIESKKEAPKPEPKKGEPKQEAKVAGSTTSAKKNLYYVQVGAIADKPTALSAAQRFKAQGYPVVVLDPLSTDRKPVFRVRIGGFLTKEEAEAVKTKLTSASGRKVDYFIVKD
jgi:cell division protein FtsN